MNLFTLWDRIVLERRSAMKARRLASALANGMQQVSQREADAPTVWCGSNKWEGRYRDAKGRFAKRPE